MSLSVSELLVQGIAVVCRNLSNMLFSVVMSGTYLLFRAVLLLLRLTANLNLD